MSTFVLLHGAWHGGWAWQRVVPVLRAAGHEVTLAWNAEDVAKLLASPVDPDGPGYQFFDLPNANYGSSNFDAVQDANGDLVGLSLFTG
jgi:hypothetical protein